MSQADAHIQSGGVLHAISSCVQKCDTTIQNIDKIKDTIAEAADVYVMERENDQEQDDSKINRVRESLLGLVQLKQDIAMYQQALRSLSGSYQGSMQSTDFQALLDQDAEAAAAAANFHPERDPVIRELDESAGLQHEEGSEDDDEELQIVGGEAHKNERCPYTGKMLLDLQDPVEDQMGFVYERAAIMDALRRVQGGILEAPIAGTSHRIRQSDIRASKAVRREQKKARRGAAGGKGKAGPSRRAGELVLDA